ncbi:MAG: hypothetical protein K2R98_33335 [Gemmataceae bacterium]|nr:hypothetical protein [Gemmataceae bacterium]
MLRRLAPALLLLLAVPSARAQEAPERLLSANTHLYLRWDGTAPQQNEYDKTAMAQILKGDAGQLVTDLLTDLKAKFLLHLLRSVSREGVVVGVELLKVDANSPPEVQLTIVLPNLKAQWEPLFGTMTWIADESGAGSKEIEVMKRTVYHLKDSPAAIAWWKEGNDAVLVISTGTPADAVKRVLAKTPRLTENPVFKKVESFKEFKTCSRGFVDLPSLFKLIGKVDPMAVKVIEDLGLNSFKELMFHHGYDGAALRTVMTCDIVGPRKGLAKLADGKGFKLGDLPPLPADVMAFTALRFDAGVVFDGTVEFLKRVLPPNDAKEVDNGIQIANQALGINIREDLIGSLGSLLVSYTPPAEGGLMFNQALMFQVKDAKRLETALDKALKGLVALSQGHLRTKTRTYHGVKLTTMDVRERAFFFQPAYTLHKDWLVIALTPQPVQGYVLRTQSELPSWKPNAVVQASLKKLPSEYTMLSVSDPAPMMKLVWSAAPMLGLAILNDSHQFRQREFDFPLLPCADEFAKHLFPNVAVATDNGKTWRMESLTSFDLPLGLGRLETAVPMMMGITLVGVRAEAQFKKVGEKIKE